MDWLVGGASHLGAVFGKALLMYVTAVIALRVSERRTLAQWTIIDFATAVAMGAIIGRTAIAGGQSYLTGAVALLTLVAVHRAASRLRFQPVFNKLIDHRIRVLIADGHIRPRELRRCGVTENDVLSQLRQHGVFSVHDVHLLLYESKGDVTIVRSSADGTDDDAIAAGLRDAVDYP
jgi:uncharacterized membrane protein YcaP (DUF421 family)